MCTAARDNKIQQFIVVFYFISNISLASFPRAMIKEIENRFVVSRDLDEISDERPELVN